MPKSQHAKAEHDLLRVLAYLVQHPEKLDILLRLEPQKRDELRHRRTG